MLLLTNISEHNYSTITKASTVLNLIMLWQCNAKVYINTVQSHAFTKGCIAFTAKKIEITFLLSYIIHLCWVHFSWYHAEVGNFGIDTTIKQALWELTSAQRHKFLHKWSNSSGESHDQGYIWAMTKQVQTTVQQKRLKNLRPTELFIAYSIYWKWRAMKWKEMRMPNINTSRERRKWLTK